MEEKKDNENVEIYSQRIKAGKRTYFFDVKSTRSNDYYLTITESKKRFKDDGFYYEKHKIFLYKEDFNKFIAALTQSVNHIKTELMPEVDFDQFEKQAENDDEENNSFDTDLKWD
ncbi:DUF3276 family protein [uncultured Cytophaga sp.]|uniref:DUF3276 family protein n=1 Tax=uncultured Cytophaga sp. TaxID=160238 RepID=UPI002632F16C|nr:DUF3276 family protein [uncultured Cytophaga sp.]